MIGRHFKAKDPQNYCKVNVDVPNSSKTMLFWEEGMQVADQDVIFGFYTANVNLVVHLFARIVCFYSNLHCWDGVRTL